jgi:hypothetical protein
MDFELGEITVRDGNGQKDRVTMLPVAQHVDVRPLDDLATLQCPSESTLQAAVLDWTFVVSEAVLQTVGAWEPRPAIRLSDAYARKTGASGESTGEAGRSGLFALAVDVQHHARSVDVGDLQPCPFQQTKSAGVDRGQTDAIDQDAAHLLAAQDHRELLLPGVDGQNATWASHAAEFPSWKNLISHGAIVALARATFFSLAR